MKQALVDFLHNEFERLKGRNPSYSLRSFAKKLQVNPSALSEVMNGKRMPTSRFGGVVSKALKLSETEHQRLVGNLPKKNTSSLMNQIARDSSYLQLERDQYEVIEHWHYFAILSLTETRGFRIYAGVDCQTLGDFHHRSDRSTRLFDGCNSCTKNQDDM